MSHVIIIFTWCMLAASPPGWQQTANTDGPTVAWLAITVDGTLGVDWGAGPGPHLDELVDVALELRRGGAAALLGSHPQHGGEAPDRLLRA